MATRVTEHFTVEEFDCKDGTLYPTQWIQSALKPLCEALEKVRALTGQPIKIHSGYRTRSWNNYIYRKKGLKPTDSLHIKGVAVDFTLEGMTILGLYNAMEKLIRNKVIPDGGLGLYYSFVHYDQRGNHARWNHTKWHTK